MDYGKLYKTNKQFKQYVDKYCNQYVEGKSIPVEEGLKHKIVQDYGKSLLEETKETNTIW